ncbi:MAG TPA: spermidine/putrescine ABC transporter substrate-binding protein [Streptosporangiaceae bacterium]|jgi:spermidine/putrescine transport system substrate-binding protein|nr:spermidine/putrescine ABC transporter substrate-binding protein [Streptosporangiaceae bacterium]
MNEGNVPVDPALARGLTRRRVSRRDALGLGGLAAAGLGLAACGGGPAASPAPTVHARTAAQDFWAGKKKHGHVNFANWPLYIDAGHKTLTEFTAATGITVSYAEVIQEDPSWFAKISPIIQARESIGYDVMVVTDGFQFSQLVALGELTPLNQSMMTNFYSYASKKFKNRSFDPGNTYSVPWASGTTGIAWNPKYIQTPVTSINELWNPAYKGRVGMMSDTQDLGNVGMIKLGINPEKSKPADWAAAAKVLAAQRKAGLVRGYYQQSYIDALRSGQTWISMAWSGDIFQQNLTSGTNFQFVIPKEGGTIWTDNMMIPKYAQNPVDAMMLMDWYYQPDIAAQLTEAINYITAVPGARPIISRDAAKASGSTKQTLSEVATSNLVWPTPAEFARLHNYADVSGKLQQQYQSIFNPVVA